MEPTDSIERFAELSAHLADGFADRPSILASADLDETAWRRLEAHWLRRLDAEPELRDRFGEAYAKARCSLTTSAEPRSGEAGGHRGPSPEVAAPGSAGNDAKLNLPVLLDEDTDPSPSPCPQPDPADRTLEVPAYRPEPALPFAVAPARTPELSERRPGTPILPPPPASGGASRADDMTLETPAFREDRPPLPFTSAPPGKRLAHFDSQTGQPLPAPTWIDAPGHALRKP